MSDDYIVPDLLAPDLKLVFCGTAPSAASAEAKAYYAKPGNMFWPTLYRIGLTPHQFTPHEYPKLLALDMGLTDVCKTECGNDDEISAHSMDLTSLRKKIECYQPKFVAFTSKHSAQLFLGHRVEYGLQKERIGLTRFYVCCSTSGRARRFWREEIWYNLTGVVNPGARFSGL